MLRALFVCAVMAFGLLQFLRGPFYGLLFYLWIAYFRPETWVWSDFVTSLNASLIVGIGVVGWTLLSTRRFALRSGSVLMILFVLQGLVSTLLSPAFAYSWPWWFEFAKTVVISLMIMILVDDERRLRLTLAIIALSLGFEGAKQGWLQLILNPGEQNFNEHAIFGDNNGVAVGMLMLVPIMIALARTATSKKERVLYHLLTIGTLYRAIITYSRGGFLACGALGLHYLFRSRRKVEAAVAVVLVSVLVIPVLPDAFWARMSTIETRDTDEADASIRGRLHFWQVALAMSAAHPLIGVGHNAYQAVYDQYDDSGQKFGTSRAVHNSWLGVLSETGYPGLLLFLAIIGKAFHACRRTRRLASRHSELDNLRTYATAVEAALVVFIVGGTFVTLQYCEMLWHLLALAMVIEHIAVARQRGAGTTRLHVERHPDLTDGPLRPDHSSAGAAGHRRPLAAHVVPPPIHGAVTTPPSG